MKKNTFIQLVLGPPGSGKTTYCNGMCSFLNARGRECSVINLDPACKYVSSNIEIDVRDLVSLNEVMAQLSLGPNGALLYCMEFLENNLDWFNSEIERSKNNYFIVDFPGQVELYTHHNSVRNILARLTSTGYRLIVAHLVDSTHCVEATNYISAVFLSLSTMLQLELPQINILSKIDLFCKYDNRSINLDFLQNAKEMHTLLSYQTQILNDVGCAAYKPACDSGVSLNGSYFKCGEKAKNSRAALYSRKLTQKYAVLNQMLVELIEEFSLVNFRVLDVNSLPSLQDLISVLDTCHGYISAKSERE
jgi:GPN-loop GTPase